MKIKNIKYYATILLTTLSISLTGCSHPKVKDGKQLSEKQIVDGIEETNVETENTLDFQRIPDMIQQSAAIESIINQAKDQIAYVQGIKEELGDLTEVEQIKIYQNKCKDAYQIEMITKNDALHISKTDDNLDSLTENLDYLTYTDCYIVRLANCDSIDALNSIPSKEKIKYIVIINSPDDDLSVLASFPNLERLKIVNCPNIENIQALSTLNQLKSISIMGTNISDITPLSELKELKYLDLKGNQLTDESVAVLKDLPSLEHIELYYNNIEDSESLDFLVERDLATEYTKKLIAASSERNDLMVTTESNLEKRSFKTLLVTKLDNKEKYFISLYGDDDELCWYGLIDSLDKGFFLECQYEEIHLMNCQDCNLLKNIDRPETIFQITFEYCDFEKLENLERFPNLIRLIVTGNPSLTDINNLSELDIKNIYSLRIENTNVEDISALASLPNLEYALIPSNKIEDAKPLLEAPRIKYVSIAYNYISDIATLEELGGKIIDYRSTMETQKSAKQKVIGE